MRLLRPEFGVRIHQTRLFTEFDPLLGWRKVANFRGVHVNPEYTTVERLNARGQRGPLFPYEKPKGVYRILVLDASFAEGYSVEFENLFSEVLSEQLNGELDREVEVINAGTGGYSTDQDLLFFLSEGYRYQPDLTVLVFVTSVLKFNVLDRYHPLHRGQKPLFALKRGKLTLESLPTQTWSREEELAIEQAKHSDENAFVPWKPERWYLVRMIRQFIESRRSAPMAAIPEASSSVESRRIESEDQSLEMVIYDQREKRQWKMAEALLAELRQQTQKYGSEFLLVYAPEPADVYDRDRNLMTWPSAIEHNLRVVASRHDIEFLPTVSLFQAQARLLAKDGRYLYFANDPHWTPEGNRLAGLILADYIARRCDRCRLTDASRATP